VPAGVEHAVHVNVVASPPAADLQHSIETYQWFECDMADGLVAAVPPLASTSLVFWQGGTFARRHPLSGLLAYPRAFVATPSEVPVELQIAGRVRLLRIVLRPQFTGALLHAPARTAVNRVLDTARVDAAGLATAVHAAFACEPALHAFEAWWRRRLRDVDAGALQALTEFLRRLSAGQRVRDAAASAALSERQLERRFLDAVGLRPKLFQRVARMNALLVQLHANIEPAWADLALRHGYTDQSHLVREFVALTGRTPGRFLENAWLPRLMLRSASGSFSLDRHVAPHATQRRGHDNGAEADHAGGQLRS
jgi:AraC-like DNA-binding protein